MNKPKYAASPLSPSALSTQPPPRPSRSQGRNVGRFHPGVRVDAGRPYRDPTTYTHPWPSMADFARLLALGTHAPRTRHSYYRDMRLLHEHFACDPAMLTQAQVTDYLIHVKMVKGWRPKTVRQTAASARLFFVEMLGHADWTVFANVRAKDHDELPLVLTREQAHALLDHIRLRRYRIPLKLIYCCGLRLSECLSLTIHDIIGSEQKLRVRHGKGGSRSPWEGLRQTARNEQPEGCMSREAAHASTTASCRWRPRCSRIYAATGPFTGIRCCSFRMWDVATMTAPCSVPACARPPLRCR